MVKYGCGRDDGKYALVFKKVSYLLCSLFKKWYCYKIDLKFDCFLR